MIDEKELLSLLEEQIADLGLPSRPRALYYPIEYTLQSGGKRLRPVLTLASCKAFSGNAVGAINQAMALEMFHNFTLIHDDVMDRSPKRRNRPTVYCRWGDVQAILSGDTLLTLATARVVREAGDNAMRVLELFNTTAIEVYEGQQFDMAFEKRETVRVKEYLEMIRLKTSVLIAAACAMGAIMGGASPEAVEAMYTYGEKLGLAFQLRDDLLDVYGDPKTFGKTIGTDIINRKKTWLYITAMHEAKEEMDGAYSAGTSKRGVIAAVRRVYDKLDLSARCAKMINRYCDEALAALTRAGMSAEDEKWFADMAHSLSQRSK
ncbi:MAG: polyprenyl synthetase family protein [Muribaculaceae bacterium]|nr:polyprenyl synthetase family protein [Muribaculaceae bacterium]